MKWGRMIAASTAIALGWSTVAHADEPAARGAKIADQWCRMCHLRATDEPDANMAPPYEEIVQRPGRDEKYFVRFLREDHFPMTIYRLFDHEKADVVAYLMTLQHDPTTHP